jgi:hypothetical protein
VKVVQALLTLIQVIAFCQLLFGIAGVELAYQDEASSIGPHFELEESYVRRFDSGYKSKLWTLVDRWHKRTIRNARLWCLTSGAAFFVLATTVRVQLWRLEKSRQAHPT